jgi:hypothetical protein
MSRKLIRALSVKQAHLETCERGGPDTGSIIAVNLRVPVMMVYFIAARFSWTRFYVKNIYPRRPLNGKKC